MMIDELYMVLDMIFRWFRWRQRILQSPLHERQRCPLVIRLSHRPLLVVFARRPLRRREVVLSHVHL